MTAHGLQRRTIQLACSLTAICTVVTLLCANGVGAQTERNPESTNIRIDGPSGPLSSAKAASIIAKLKSGTADSDILDRHLAVEDAVAGSPLTVGNHVLLLQDGPATYTAMYAAIKGARDHINMETYIFDNDEVGERFAQALIDKKLSGVQVNLIRDSAGTVGVPGAFFARMIDSGINVLEFNPLNPLASRKAWEVNRRDHRKLLIVDGVVAYLGGINIIDSATKRMNFIGESMSNVYGQRRRALSKT